MATLLTLAALVAHADAAAPARRPSDSRIAARDGRGEAATRLDIAYVSLVGGGGGTATFTIRTHEAWPCAYLENEPLGGYSDGDGVFLRWDIDRDGDRYYERAGNFHCRGRMVLEMSDSDLVFGARKPNGRTLRVDLPLRRLGLDVASLRVRANSQVNGVSDGSVFFEEGDSSPVLAP